MTQGSELRRLKSEIGSFDCLNYEDLKFYTGKIATHIRRIYESGIPVEPLMKDYVECVILKHLEIIEDFINDLPVYKGKEEFVTKALRYHFNCIIDSYTYATIAYQH
jgi:hypothetical protein